MKKFRLGLFLFVLVLFGTIETFAQAGNKGGSDGIHQYNAYTLGKFGMTAGSSGYGTFDSYAYSGDRYYTVYDNDNVGITGGGGRYKVGAFAPSMEMMFYMGVGLSKYLDVGAYLPYYGDLAASVGSLFGEPNGAGEAELWASGFGDLALWTKIRAEFFPDDFLFSAAFYFELDIPTGERGYGMRVRHPWYYNTNDGYTHPFTASDIVAMPMLIGTFDFKKKGYAPLRWNTYIGMALPTASYGSNTWVYGTGLNILPNKLFENQPDSLDISFFAEFHGESRFEKTNMHRMPLDLDVMNTTGGVKFSFKEILDITLAFEMSVKAYAYLFGYERNTSHGYEFHRESAVWHESVTSDYAISGNPFYGGYVNVAIHFGGAEEPPPEPVIVRDTVVIRDTLIDTVVVTRFDTVTITPVCPVYEEKVCPEQMYPDFSYFKKGIHFKIDSYELQDRSKHILDELTDLLKMLPYLNLDIEAHTDSVGSEEHNDSLSEHRAKAVVMYLINRGVAPERLRATWKGEHQPVDDNGTNDGRRRNRRVELIPFDKDTGVRAGDKGDGSGSDLYQHNSSDGKAILEEGDDYTKYKKRKKKSGKSKKGKK